MRRALPLVLLSVFVLAACGGNKNNNPTGPSTTTTKIISVTGNLAFGNVNLGQTATQTFTIANSGNATLTVTGLTAVGGTGTAGTGASPLTGSIQPGGSLPITFTFTPTIAQFYSAVITVASDATSGNDAINFSGTGINNNPLFTMSGTGNTVFTMPAYVQNLHVTASYNGNSSNFIVWIGPSGSSCSTGAGTGCRLLVNELMGTLWNETTYDSGTIQTGGGGTVSVSKSDSVSWTMTEVR